MSPLNSMQTFAPYSVIL